MKISQLLSSRGLDALIKLSCSNLDIASLFPVANVRSTGDIHCSLLLLLDLLLTFTVPYYCC